MQHNIYILASLHQACTSIITSIPSHCFVIEAKLSIFALLHVHNVCIILDSILVSSTQSALNTQISPTVDCKNYLAITRKHKLRLFQLQISGWVPTLRKQPTSCWNSSPSARILHDSLLSICHLCLHQVLPCIPVRALESECCFKVSNGLLVPLTVSKTV